MEYGHNLYLLLASLAIALMSGFTGLSLTRGASAIEIGHRKLVVSMSAIALGGGIWSMHFVAMLGMTLPVPFHYDALITMVSALVAILLTGIALLLVHFGDRTPQKIISAGLCAGCGILAMHYLGMSGIQDVKIVYSTLGIVIAIIASLILCVASFWISYSERGKRNILVATIVFGSTVVAVHFIAMAGTHFVKVDGGLSTGLWLSNEVLAFGVTMTSFIISGAFLLVGVTFSVGQGFREDGDVSKYVMESGVVLTSNSNDKSIVRIPYESTGQTHFVHSDEVAAVQADGRYTLLYHNTGCLFCPWSLTSIETKLNGLSFVKGHRSYLINTDHVTSFERNKDNGQCFFDGNVHLDHVPISRSYLKNVRARLGL
jgi:NO-binding membrane sensor protein with MHYT domain